MKIHEKGHDTATPIIGDHSAATTCSGGMVEVVVPQNKRERPPGSMDTRPRKKVSLVQLNPFIINTRNLSHEVISDYSYVQELILRDASMNQTISKNREISMNYGSMLEMLERNSIILVNVFYLFSCSKDYRV